MSSARVPRARLQIINLHGTRRFPVAELERALYSLEGPRRRSRETVNLALVGDAEIASLAERYRGERHATDVLAFGYGTGDEEGAIGDVAISLDRAAVQARQRGLSLVDEVKLLAVHGLLHISGQCDETLRDWKMMKRLEFESMMRIL